MSDVIGVRRKKFRVRRLLIGLTIGAVFVLAGCGEDEGAEPASTTSQSTTSGTVNSTTARTTTSTTAASTATSSTVTSSPAASSTVRSTNERASGAGCTPASADTLAAGRWFGFVEDAQAEQLSFDLACWFTGEAAEAAAAEDGEESPPPNDYHIRNESNRLRIHPVDSGTEVEWLPNPGDPQSAEVVTYAEWLAGRATRTTNPGVWLTVEDDSHVMRIEEQYVP